MRSLMIHLFLLIPVFLSAQIQDSSFFLPPPEEWNLIGEATFEDFQQCFGFGDFDGDSQSELVGNYSHGAIGLFIHDFNGREWVKSVIHPKFDPAFRQQGMDGSWPVKGLVSGDFDGDGLTELITMADQIMYPPIHQAARYPFPGCVYIDWDDTQNEFIVNPLVWGKWGEEIGSNKAAIMIMIPVSTHFRASGYNEDLTDFLVSTMCTKVKDSRLFVLEQPPETFSSCDYRYVTPDSIDANLLYPHDAFYVKRFYLGTEGGDIELFFSHTGSPFPDVASVSNSANIFDYDDDGLYDLFVCLSYMDNDTLAIERLCGAGIRIYHRLPAKDGHDYRFELAFQKDIAGIKLGSPTPAELNGNPADGKEGWILGTGIDTSMTNEINTVPGVAAVYKEGEEWKVLGTRPAEASLAEYTGTYSYVSVYDYDGDGYDDAVIQCNKEVKELPYLPAHEYLTSDIKLFRNMAGEIRDYEEFFSHDAEASRVLWPDDAFTWDVHMEDFDDDGEPELGIALNRREPAWGATLGKYGIYYMEPVWEYTRINELEAGSREEPVHLFQDYPNPFNNSTTIKFEISKKIPVTISVCNINGQVVDFLLNRKLSPGSYTIEWNPREHNKHSIPGGVYFCFIEAEGVKQVKKLMLLK